MGAHLTYAQLVGKRVAVYRNLTKDTFSVQIKGLVVSHQDEVYLKDAEFRVSEPSRQRAIREGQRNVHARVWGTVIEPTEVGSTEVYYNPFQTETFVVGSEPIFTSPSCLLRANRCYV